MFDSEFDERDAGDSRRWLDADHLNNRAAVGDGPVIWHLKRGLEQVYGLVRSDQGAEG